MHLGAPLGSANGVGTTESRQSQWISKKNKRNYRAHSPKNLAHHIILQNFGKTSTPLSFMLHVEIDGTLYINVTFSYEANIVWI